MISLSQKSMVNQTHYARDQSIQVKDVMVTSLFQVELHNSISNDDVIEVFILFLLDQKSFKILTSRLKMKRNILLKKRYLS